MNVTAVIAEYNPFHMGHSFHLRKTREAGATHIVAVMSGSFVQRGDVAVMTAHERAEMAVEGGADLVLELPPQCALTPARDFAARAVSVIKRLNCVNSLSFGAENADIPVLQAALEDLEKHELDIKEKMSAGMTYPQAASEVCSEASKIISGQNNTLAVEYLRALRGTNITPFAVKRTVRHDSDEIFGDHASASHIRELLRQDINVSSLLGYPVDDADFSFIEDAERIILYKLSTMTRDEFAEVPGCKELANRFYYATRRSESLKVLYSEIKSKNFTLSKIRRCVMLAVLGITNADMGDPPFARILALNDRGAQVLKMCRRKAEIDVADSLKDLSVLSPAHKRQAEIIELASRFQSLCRLNCGYASEYKMNTRLIRRK